MGIFNQTPKSKDRDYIDNFYFDLVNVYQNCYSYCQIDYNPEIVGFDSLKKYLEQYSDYFCLKIQITKTEVFGEIIDNIPQTHYWEEKEGELIISITVFGFNNPEVTISEVLLFLISAKLGSDNLIELGSEFDSDDIYRPFLLVAGIFFGLGAHFLLRVWIIGRYEDLEGDFYNYKYNLPLDMETIVYACAVFELINSIESDIYIKSKPFSYDIIKEYNRVKKFLFKNKSDVLNVIKKMKLQD